MSQSLNDVEEFDCSNYYKHYQYYRDNIYEGSNTRTWVRLWANTYINLDNICENCGERAGSHCAIHAHCPVEGKDCEIKFSPTFRRPRGRPFKPKFTKEINL